jgi:hypothetical protein
MEYFRDIYNAKDPEDDITEQQSSEQLSVTNAKIMRDEVRNAIKLMMNGKAAGNDINSELLKNSSETSTELLITLLNKIWQEEKTPEDWCKRLILKIPKKGDNTRCEN